MVKGVDELIYFLLDRISIRAEGATYGEIKRLVEEFYSQLEDNNLALFLRRTDLNATSPAPEPPASALVDALLLNKVWQWLTEEPDISVGQDAEHAKLQSRVEGTSADSHLAQGRDEQATQIIADAAQVELQIEAQGGSENIPPLISAPSNAKESRLVGSSESISIRNGLSQIEDRSESLYDGLVLRAKPERIWQAITGHGIDESRVPKLEFQLLSLIASAGKQGIAQTDLLALSKQDKRSVPKRTDDLCSKGYIFKTALRRPGGNTSHCVLRKFAKVTHAQGGQEPWLQMLPAEVKASVFPEGAFQKAKFLTAAMVIIKQAGIITVDDFRARMGLTGTRAERQSGDLWLYHMDLIGCIERVLAKASAIHDRRKKPNLRTLKFLKDVDDTAQEAFLKFQSKDRQTLWLDKHSMNEEAYENSTPLDSVKDTYDNGHLDDADDKKSILRWHPQQALENQIYDVINDSGREGITTNDLVASITGASSYRTVDTMLARLTDIWQEAQPLHLRHLAVIRDTSLRNGTLSYLYRTYPNFDLAVKAGEANWEAIEESYQSFKKSRGHKDPIPSKLDAWGFPEMPEHEIDASKSTRSTQEHQKYKLVRTLQKPKEDARVVQSPKRRGRPPLNHNPSEDFQEYQAKAIGGHKQQNQPRLHWVVPENQEETPSMRKPLKMTKMQLEFSAQMLLRATDLLESQTLSPDDQDVNNEARPTQYPPILDSTLASYQDSRMIGRNELGRTYVGQSENHDAVDRDGEEIKGRQTRNRRKRKISTPQTTPSVPLRLQEDAVFEAGSNVARESSPQKRQRVDTFAGLSMPKDDPNFPELYRSLLLMSRPGLYINPPQRLLSGRGRPGNKMMVVIKTGRLHDMDWFRNSSGSERYYHDPSKTFHSPVDTQDFVESSIGPPQIDLEQTLAEEEIQTLTPRESISIRLGRTKNVAAALKSRPGDSHTFDLDDHAMADELSHEEVLAPVEPDSGSHVETHTVLSPNGRMSNIVKKSFKTNSKTDHDNNKKSSEVSDRTMASNRRILGVRLSGGSQGRHRTDILLQIIKEAGGVYPGPRELWYPFVTALRKADDTFRVDPGTVERAVMNIVQSGKLRRLQFAFKVGGGASTTKSIIALPGFEANSGAVKALERKMIEHYPENFLPDVVEIDPSLNLQDANRLVTRKVIPARTAGYVPAPHIEVQRTTKYRDLKRTRVKPFQEDEDVEEEEEEDVSDEQRALQSEFLVSGYFHQPEAVPQGRNTAGHSLGKILHFGPSNTVKKPKDALPVPSHAPPYLDPRLLEEEEEEEEEDEEEENSARAQPDFLKPIQRQSRLRRSRENTNLSPLKFIIATESLAAAQQEFLREQLAQQDEFYDVSRGRNDKPMKTDPNSWIISSWSCQNARGRRSSTVAVTLTDPAQCFNAYSGTFSTDFAVFRDIRPKLVIQPNLQREFEAQIPNSLEHIIELQRGRRRPGPRAKNPASFDSVVGQVLAWEQDNSELLTSAGSLMVPRFINHTPTQKEDLSFVAPRSPSHIQENSRKRKETIMTEEGEPKRQKRKKRPCEDIEVQQAQSEQSLGDAIGPDLAIHLSLVSSLPSEASETGRTISQTTKPIRRRVPNVSRPGALGSHAMSNILPASEQVTQGLISPSASIVNRIRPSTGWEGHKRPGRRPARTSKLTESQIKRLVAVVVVVRCLIGGIDRAIKWPLVAELFPDFPVSGIKYRWNLIIATRGNYVEHLEKAFQDDFIRCYEKGEVGTPDYDNIDKFDWQAAVDWASERTINDQQEYLDENESEFEGETTNYSEDISSDETSTETLFEDRKRFERSFMLQQIPGPSDTSVNELLNPLLPVIRRKQILGDIPFSVLLTGTTSARRFGDATEFGDIVKSYVRANVLAPTLGYDPGAAKARLSPFGDETLELAIKELQKAKVIKQKNKGRVVPGRNFSIAKTFFDSFKQHWKFEILASAVRYKNWLEERFKTDEYVEFHAHASQGDVIAIMNLYAAGRIDIQIVPPSITKDPAESVLGSTSDERRISIWGFTEGNYKTTYVQPENYMFPLRITPSTSWINGCPLQSSSRREPPAPHLPGRFKYGLGQLGGRIPLWYDIHDRLQRDIWELTVAAVINTIGLAPGSSVKEVVSMCKNVIDEWDVRLVLAWMEDIGVATTTQPGGDRFIPNEWWWYILGTGNDSGASS